MMKITSLNPVQAALYQATSARLKGERRQALLIAYLIFCESRSLRSSTYKLLIKLSALTDLTQIDPELPPSPEVQLDIADYLYSPATRQLDLKLLHLNKQVNSSTSDSKLSSYSLREILISLEVPPARSKQYVIHHLSLIASKCHNKGQILVISIPKDGSQFEKEINQHIKLPIIIRTLGTKDIRMDFLRPQKFGNRIFVSGLDQITDSMLESNCDIYISSTCYIANRSQACISGTNDFVRESSLLPITKDSSKENYYSLQLITCTHNSIHLIDDFLDNHRRLISYSVARGLHVFHSFIDSQPNIKLLFKLDEYFSEVDGFYVLLEVDPGLYQSWNQLIKIGNSRFISNSNPDDFRDHKHAVELVNALENHPECLVASSNVIPYDDLNDRKKMLNSLFASERQSWFSDTPSLYTIDSLYRIDESAKARVKPHNIPHCSPVWKRSLHSSIGYFDEYTYGSEADWALWCEYTYQGNQVVHVNKDLSAYYIDNASYGRSRKQVKAHQRILDNFIFSSPRIEPTQKRKIKLFIHGINHCFGRHRFKNNIYLDAISDLHDEKAELTFIWFLEKYFLWGRELGEIGSKEAQPLRTFMMPWFGVLHVPPLTPKFAGNQFAQLFFSEQWRKSMARCKGLICLSEYMSNDIKKIYPDIPVYTISHPFPDNVEPSFDIEAFAEDPTVVLSGFWLRNHIDFYRWNTSFRKLHLIKPESKEILEEEFKSFAISHLDPAKYKVDTVNFLSNAEYDRLMQRSIFFLCLYDTSANNALLECIHRCTPFVSYRHPAIEEYVGCDYPLFTSYEELNGYSTKYMLHLVKEAHKYLCKHRTALKTPVSDFKRNIQSISEQIYCQGLS
jgi:hypothetical protein